MALALLLLPMAGIKPVRRRLRKLPDLPVVLAAATLALGAMVCLSGCSSNGFFNQAAKSYTVVVTATDTATGARSSTNVTLTVQQAQVGESKAAGKWKAACGRVSKH
jgi:hypothetical protein